MLNSPFTTFTTSAGVVACSRDLDQLPSVLEAVGRRGVILGRPKTWRRIVEKYGDIFARDDEGGPSAILWRSVIPAEGKGKRSNAGYPDPIRWPDVPGSSLLCNLLTEDEMRYLKFTLNCQKWFTNEEIKSDGFATYSTVLVAFLGDKI